MTAYHVVGISKNLFAAKRDIFYLGQVAPPNDVLTFDGASFRGRLLESFLSLSCVRWQQLDRMKNVLICQIQTLYEFKTQLTRTEINYRSEYESLGSYNCPFCLKKLIFVLIICLCLTLGCASSEAILFLRTRPLQLKAVLEVGGDTPRPRRYSTRLRDGGTWKLQSSVCKRWSVVRGCYFEAWLDCIPLGQ